MGDNNIFSVTPTLIYNFELRDQKYLMQDVTFAIHLHHLCMAITEGVLPFCSYDASAITALMR